MKSLICQGLNIQVLIRFKRCIKGARAYISFTGTLKIQPLMDSYATHVTAKLGAIRGAIEDNHILATEDSHHLPEKQLTKQLQPFFSGNYLVRCVPSLETNLFSAQQVSQFYQQGFHISPDVNRMGLRLQGLPISFPEDLSITSSGLTQGSIQVPPSGIPIISSVDGQTIGGYPRIANVIRADLPLLGQLRPKDKINFTNVDLDYADKLLAESNQMISELID